MTRWRAIALATAYIVGAVALYRGYYFAWRSSAPPMSPEYYADLQLKAAALFWVGAGAHRGRGRLVDLAGVEVGTASTARS